MDAVLRQSTAVCPFLKKATPASLRALSTISRPKVKASPCGGTISKLQLLAHRCPVMGKAMAVQSGHMGRVGMSAAAAVTVAGLSTGSFPAHAKTSKARIHTSRNQEARAVDGAFLNGREKSECLCLGLLTCSESASH